MEVAMETYMDVRLILRCAVPVTNDVPRALFPNIDTARNNIAELFSQMKSRAQRRHPGLKPYVHVSQAYYSWIFMSSTHNTCRLTANTHICTFISRHYSLRNPGVET